MWDDIRFFFKNKEYSQRLGVSGSFLFAPIFAIWLNSGKASLCSGFIGGCFGLIALCILGWGIGYLGIKGLCEDTGISCKRILFTTVIYVVFAVTVFVALLFLLLPLLVGLMTENNVDSKQALDTVKTIDNAKTIFDFLKIFK